MLSSLGSFRLLDELDGLARFESQSVQVLAGHEHLSQIWDLNDHASHLRGQRGQTVRACSLQGLIGYLSHYEIDVRVDERPNQIPLGWLINAHELRAVQHTS